MLFTYDAGVALGVWADGYLPTIPAMKTLIRERLREEEYKDEDLAQVVKRGRRDLLFWAIGPMCEPRHPSDFLDVFCFAPRTGARGPPMYEGIYSEWEKDKRMASYRCLAFVYYNRRNWDTAIDEEAAENHAKQAISSLRFEVKRLSAYEDCDTYRTAGLALLEELVEPYVGPCLVVEDRLSRAGFRGAGLGLSPMNIRPLWTPRDSRFS